MDPKHLKKVDAAPTPEELEKRIASIRKSMHAGERAGQAVRGMVNFLGRALGFIQGKSGEPSTIAVPETVEELFENQPEGVRNLARHLHDHGPLADDLWEFADLCQHVLDFRRGADFMRMRAWIFPGSKACDSVDVFGAQCQRIRCDGVHAAWLTELHVWVEGDYPHRSWLLDTSLFLVSQKAYATYCESNGGPPNPIEGFSLESPCLDRSTFNVPCELRNDHGPIHLNFSAGVPGRSFLYWRVGEGGKFATRRGR